MLKLSLVSSLLCLLARANFFQSSCDQLIDGLKHNETIIGVGLAKSLADFPYRSQLEAFLKENSKLPSSSVVLYSFVDTADNNEEIIQVHYDSLKDRSESAIAKGLDDLVARANGREVETVPIFEVMSCGSNLWPSTTASVHLILSGGYAQNQKSSYTINSKQCRVDEGQGNLSPDNWKRQSILVFDPSLSDYWRVNASSLVDKMFGQNLTYQEHYSRFAGDNVTIAELRNRDDLGTLVKFESRAAFCDSPDKAADSTYRTQRFVPDPPQDCAARFFGNVDSVTVSGIVDEGGRYVWEMSLRQMLTEFVKLMPDMPVIFHDLKDSNLECLYKDVDIEQCNRLDSLGSGLSAIINADAKYSQFKHPHVHISGEWNNHKLKKGFCESVSYLQAQQGQHVNLFFSSFVEDGIWDIPAGAIQRYVNSLKENNVAVISILPDDIGDDSGYNFRTEFRETFSDKQVLVLGDDLILRDPAIMAADMAARVMRAHCYYPRTKSVPKLLEGSEISRLRAMAKKINLRIAVSISRWNSWAWNSLNMSTVFSDVETKLKEIVDDVNVTFVTFKDDFICVKDSTKPMYEPIQKADLTAQLKAVEEVPRVVDTTAVGASRSVGLDILYGLGVIDQSIAEDEIAINIVVTQGQVQTGDKVTDLSLVGTEGACGTVYQHPEAKSHYAAIANPAKTFNYVLLGIDEWNYRNASDWQTKINGNLGDFRATVVDLDIGPLPASVVSEGLTNEILNQLCIQMDKTDSSLIPSPTFETCEYNPSGVEITVWFQANANIARLGQGDLKSVINEIQKNFTEPISYGLFQSMIEGECKPENNRNIVVMKSSDPDMILAELNRIPFLSPTAEMTTRSYGLNLLAVKDNPSRPSVNILFAVGNPVTSDTAVPNTYLSQSDLGRMGLCYGVQQHPTARQLINTRLGHNTRNYVFLVPYYNGYINKTVWKDSINDVFQSTTKFVEEKTGLFDMTAKHLADVIQRATVEGICLTNTTTPNSPKTSLRPIIIGCTIGAIILSASVGGALAVRRPKVTPLEMQDDPEIDVADLRCQPAALTVGEDQVAFLD